MFEKANLDYIQGITRRAGQLVYMKGNTIPVFLSENGVINTVHELSLGEFAKSQKPSPKCPQQSG